MFLIGIILSSIAVANGQDYPPNVTPSVDQLANIRKTYYVIFTHDLPADNYSPQVTFQQSTAYFNTSFSLKVPWSGHILQQHLLVGVILIQLQI